MKVSESEWLTLTLVVEKEGYKQASKQADSPNGDKTDFYCIKHHVHLNCNFNSYVDVQWQT